MPKWVQITPILNLSIKNTAVTVTKTTVISPHGLIFKQCFFEKLVKLLAFFYYVYYNKISTTERVMP